MPAPVRSAVATRVSIQPLVTSTSLSMKHKTLHHIGSQSLNHYFCQTESFFVLPTWPKTYISAAINRN